MKKFIITEEVLSNLVKYLASKPYAEVAQGIQALSKLEEFPQEPKAAE